MIGLGFKPNLQRLEKYKLVKPKKKGRRRVCVKNQIPIIIELRALGFTLYEIGEALDLSHQTINNKIYELRLNDRIADRRETIKNDIINSISHGEK